MMPSGSVYLLSAFALITAVIYAILIIKSVRPFATLPFTPIKMLLYGLMYASTIALLTWGFSYLGILWRIGRIGFPMLLFILDVLGAVSIVAVNLKQQNKQTPRDSETV